MGINGGGNLRCPCRGPGTATYCMECEFVRSKSEVTVIVMVLPDRTVRLLASYSEYCPR